MTREKAIKALKWFKTYNEEDYCGGDRIQDEHGDWYYRITEQDFEAFDIAIKNLEKEPNEVCDWFKQYIDIPSNTVLIEFSDGTSKRVKRGEYLANVENDLRRMMQVQIERESYEDAIRPKGHWILTEAEEEFEEELAEEEFVKEQAISDMRGKE